MFTSGLVLRQVLQLSRAQRHGLSQYVRWTRSFSTLNQAIATWKRYNEAGVFYLKQNEYEKAEHMFRACLDLDKNKNPALDMQREPYLAISIANLGMVIRRQQRYDEAKRVLEQAAAELKRFYPGKVSHQQVIGVHTELARCARHTSDWLAAAESLEIALNILASASKLPPPPISPTTPISDQATALEIKTTTVTFHLAQALHKHAEQLKERSSDASDQNRARALLESGKVLETALGHYQRAVAAMTEHCGNTAIELVPMLSSWAMALVHANKFEDAKKQLWAVIQIHRLNKNEKEMQDAMNQYASVSLLVEPSRAEDRQKKLQILLQSHPEEPPIAPAS